MDNVNIEQNNKEFLQKMQGYNKVIDNQILGKEQNIDLEEELLENDLFNQPYQKQEQQQQEEEETKEEQKTQNQSELQAEQYIASRILKAIYSSKQIIQEDGKEIQEKLLNEYILGDQIGRGSFGKVRLVTREYYLTDEDYEKQQNKQRAVYAAKIFEKSSLEGKRFCRYEDNSGAPRMMNYLDQVEEEIEISQYFNHPNICKIYQIIDDCDDIKERIYLIMPNCDLGQIMVWNDDLAQYEYNEKIIDFLSEKYQIQENVFEKKINLIAKIIFKQLLTALSYLHEEMLVIHRDIKPDNILVKSEIYEDEPDTYVKLSDFSTIKKLKSIDQLNYDCAGTAGFRGPEQQFSSDGYLGPPCDVWSLGITLYVYINGGKLPWMGDSELEMDIMSKNNQIQFDQSKFLCPELIDLISKMCMKTQQDRLTLKQVISHKWFQ